MINPASWAQVEAKWGKSSAPCALRCELCAWHPHSLPRLTQARQLVAFAALLWQAAAHEREHARVSASSLITGARWCLPLEAARGAAFCLLRCMGASSKGVRACEWSICNGPSACAVARWGPCVRCAVTTVTGLQYDHARVRSQV